MTLTPTEHANIRDILKREPTQVELIIFDTMWSEHCSYKSSKDVLRTLPTKGSEIALGVGEDSGIIRFVKHNGKQYCLVLSHESHNHPSQILPVEGAATGVGGCVRDVYCMGADVIGVMNSLHFGLETNSAKPNPMIDEIETEVINGVSGYANPLGVPVLGGETVYHPSYNDNCLVNVAAIGLMDEADIIHSFVPKIAKEIPYDVILVGKSTDATGFGGASFSSATLDADDNMTNLGAVQIHDPFLKRVLVEAFKAFFELLKTKDVEIGCKDLGAGGISCATSELAVAANMGIKVDLDKVNCAIQDLPPEVIACSETQERFCLAVPKSLTQEILTLFNTTFALPEIYPQAGAVVIGEVTPDTDYVLLHQGKEVCRLPVSAITTDVFVERLSKSPDIKPQVLSTPEYPFASLPEFGLHLMALPNIRSKRYVYRFFDNAVRGDTVVYPGETDAVVTTPIAGCNAGVATSMDSNFYGDVNPYECGSQAVAESVRNIIAVGARPIAITDCLNFGNPEIPEVFNGFKEAVRGIGDAAKVLGFIPDEPLPILAGNVSLYNESKSGNAIVPSPVIMCVGRVEDYQLVRTMRLRQAGLHLYKIGSSYDEFGSTQIAHVVPNVSGNAPSFKAAEEVASNKTVYELYQNGVIEACHDVSLGGTFATLSEMILGERGLPEVGLALDLASSNWFVELFAENGAFIIAVDETKKLDVETIASKYGATFTHLGQTTNTNTLVIHAQGQSCSISTDDLKTAWLSRCL